MKTSGDDEEKLALLPCVGHVPQKVIDVVGDYRVEFKYAQDYDLILRITERYCAKYSRISLQI